jgi:hypothetical protein
MLRKMFLVSEDQMNKTKKIPPPPQKEPKPKNKRVIKKQNKKKNNNSQHYYDKWVKMRNEIREDQIRHNTQIKAIADFLQKVLRSHPQQQSKKVSFKTESLSDPEKHKTTSKRRLEFEPSPETVYESLPSTSSTPQDVFYDTPKRSSDPAA